MDSKDASHGGLDIVETFERLRRRIHILWYDQLGHDGFLRVVHEVVAPRATIDEQTISIHTDHRTPISPVMVCFDDVPTAIGWATSARIGTTVVMTYTWKILVIFKGKPH